NSFEEQTHAITGVNVPRSSINNSIVGSIEIISIVVGVGAIASVVIASLLRSARYGRDIKISGTSAEAASTLGLRTGLIRFEAFLIASVFAGFAGVLYVCVVLYVAPSSFTVFLSVLLFFMIIVGGQGSVLGP